MNALLLFNYENQTASNPSQEIWKQKFAVSGKASSTYESHFLYRYSLYFPLFYT